MPTTAMGITSVFCEGDSGDGGGLYVKENVPMIALMVNRLHALARYLNHSRKRRASGVQSDAVSQSQIAQKLRETINQKHC